MHRLSKYKLSIIGFIAGGITGYAYYAFVGCSNGSCRISSSPLYSTLYAALLGVAFFNLFKNEKSKKYDEHDQEPIR